MKNDTPIETMLRKYAGGNRVRFHMPGHKGRGKGIPAGWDITEAAGADNLHCPEGVIKLSQEMCASSFGAHQSFFLVNGSTAGVAAMMLYAGSGKKVIIGRDCHRSAVSALILSGAEPVFIPVDYDRKNRIYGCVKADDVLHALDENPDAAAVFLTRPNYYGLCSVVESIARAVREKGKLLLIDEAHGAHFPFHPRLPETSGKLGADMWVQSVHKTLPALTQGALLHTGERVDEKGIQNTLALLQTSSPSYPVMASIESARAVMDKKGEMLLDKILGLVDAFYEDLASIRGIKPLDWMRVHGAAAKDPLRLVLDVAEREITGYEAARHLSSRGIEPEMADARRVVFICTAADRRGGFEKLLKALSELPEPEKKAQGPPQPAKLPKAVMSPRQAHFSAAEWIPIENCS
ncbi:MAG: arginine decarboxylase, partial [Bacillota bacterium]|nr:arginine decarboxylase [Bacillota bacterium]